jgi:hypothetical protein
VPTVSLSREKLFLFDIVKATEKKRDPDPYQNVTDPEHAQNAALRNCIRIRVHRNAVDPDPGFLLNSTILIHTNVKYTYCH